MSRELPYGEGKYFKTKSAYLTWIRGALRRAWTLYPPQNKYKRSRSKRVVVLDDEGNPKVYKSGKKKGQIVTRLESPCDECKGIFPSSKVQVDHIEGNHPLQEVSDISGYAFSLFGDEGNWQLLCENCHSTIKTPKDREIAREILNARKDYPKEESSWRNMKSRCDNPNATNYQYYGGRGITYDIRWKSFSNFLEDMGERPEGTTLDRIDYDGNYTKNNCRWASRIEQARNTSANTFLLWDGELLCIEEWAEKLKIKANTISTRLKRGWSIGESLGLIERDKQPYNGKLSFDDIKQIVNKIESGKTTLDCAKEFSIDASQISRLYHKFKNHWKVDKEVVERERLKQIKLKIIEFKKIPIPDQKKILKSYGYEDNQITNQKLREFCFKEYLEGNNE